MRSTVEQRDDASELARVTLAIRSVPFHSKRDLMTSYEGQPRRVPFTVVILGVFLTAVELGRGRFVEELMEGNFLQV